MWAAVSCSPNRTCTHILSLNESKYDLFLTWFDLSALRTLKTASVTSLLGFMYTRMASAVSVTQCNVLGSCRLNKRVMGQNASSEKGSDGTGVKKSRSVRFRRCSIVKTHLFAEDHQLVTEEHRSNSLTSIESLLSTPVARRLLPLRLSLFHLHTPIPLSKLLRHPCPHL